MQKNGMIEAAAQVRNARRMTAILVAERKVEKKIANSRKPRGLERFRTTGADALQELNGSGGILRGHFSILRESTACRRMKAEG